MGGWVGWAEGSTLHLHKQLDNSEQMARRQIPGPQAEHGSKAAAQIRQLACWVVAWARTSRMGGPSVSVTTPRRSTQKKYTVTAHKERKERNHCAIVWQSW